MIHLVCPNPAVDRTLLLDGPLRSDVPNRPEAVREFPGGKSFNVAHAIKHVNPDEKLVVHTVLGGKNGERVRALAAERGVDVEAIQIDKSTRECNIIVDTQDSIIYPVYERGFTLTREILDAYTKQLLDAIKPNDVVVFSGSLMKGMPDDYIVQIEEALADDSVKILVDTSGPALKEVYEKGNPGLIKINDEEFNELFGTDLSRVEDFIDYLKHQVKPSIQQFIVTLGADGAVAKLQDRYVHLYLDPIEVKNPVASGDYFLGGLTAGIVKNDDLMDNLNRAIAFSTSNCLYWYPHIDQDDVDFFMKNVKKKEY